MPTLRVDSIVDRSNTGAPTLTEGVTIPSGKTISSSGNMNVVGIVTATFFIGNGTNLNQFSSAIKAWSSRLILDPLPFRS